jgi:hypothetical protein
MSGPLSVCVQVPLLYCWILYLEFVEMNPEIGSLGSGTSKYCCWVDKVEYSSLVSDWDGRKRVLGLASRDRLIFLDFNK